MLYQCASLADCDPNFFIFSSPGQRPHELMAWCGACPCVRASVRASVRPSLTPIFDISSETTGQISMNLHRMHVCRVAIQVCTNRRPRSKK